MLRRFVKALAAVLAGAAMYWVIRPHLPAVARHQIFHEDLGLLVYGLISALIYGLLCWFDRK
jgi:H+/gluconate symporter-like permease